MTAITSLSTLTALYSPLDREYSQEMSGPYGDMSHSLPGGEIVAGLKDGKASGFWRPMVCVGTEDFQKQQLHWVDECIDVLYMDFLVDGLSPISRFLLAKGYKAKPYYTQIIDLTKTEEELRHGLRKSYKSLVNKDSYINDMFDTGSYQRLHESLRGVTRPQETWDIQNKMIWQRQAFCLTQTQFKDMQNPSMENTVVEAGLIVYHNEHCAYYASGAGVNNHALMWHAILKAKKLGCKRFEMGEQVFGDSKEANISKFKKGFGGITEARLIIEREEG